MYVPAVLGAVYTPSLVMVPPPGSTTDQITAVFEEFCTVAVNRDGAPVFSVSAGPATFTVIAGGRGGGGLEEPHPARQIATRQAAPILPGRNAALAGVISMRSNHSGSEGSEALSLPTLFSDIFRENGLFARERAG